MRRFYWCWCGLLRTRSSGKKAKGMSRMVGSILWCWCRVLISYFPKTASYEWQRSCELSCQRCSLASQLSSNQRWIALTPSYVLLRLYFTTSDGRHLDRSRPRKRLIFNLLGISCLVVMFSTWNRSLVHLIISNLEEGRRAWFDRASSSSIVVLLSIVAPADDARVM